MTDAAPTRLKPIVTLDIKFFWDACDKGELRIERCTSCQQFRFPPRPMCPNCHSTKREHVKVSGRGKVYSWIRPVHPKPVGFNEPPVNKPVVFIQPGGLHGDAKRTRCGFFTSASFRHGRM